MTEYIEKEFIQKDSVEKRDYQINLASQAINENCIVVLPTGLGKTTVALHVISEYLKKKSGTIDLPAVQKAKKSSNQNCNTY